MHLDGIILLSHSLVMHLNEVSFAPCGEGTVMQKCLLSMGILIAVALVPVYMKLFGTVYLI